MKDDRADTVDRHYERVKRIRETFLKKRAAAAKEYNQAIAPHLEEFKTAIAEHEKRFKRKFSAARREHDAGIERSSKVMQARLQASSSSHGDKYDPASAGVITVAEAMADLEQP